MAEKIRKKHVLIVGNPNAGKTTLYNALTGRNERVGNWHGVTVESSSAENTINGVEFIFTDVPGIYSLKEYAAEEANAAKTIFGGKFDAIIVVTEADKLKRGLKLVRELRSFHAPILLFINLYGSFSRRGGRLSEKELEKRVGAKVICGEDVNLKDVEKIRRFLTGNLSVLPADNHDFGYIQAKPKLSKLENLLVGKFTALPIFAAVMLFCFWLAFGESSPVSLISEAISRLFNDFIGNRIYIALYKKNLFLATLSHDLKNPLQAQISTLELFNKGAFGELNNTQKEILEMMLESSKYMRTMLYSLLKTCKENNGIIYLEKKYFDIKKF